MDAALGVGPGWIPLPLVVFCEGLHGTVSTQTEELIFDMIIILESVLSTGGIEYPVSDVYQIQQSAKFLICQFNMHILPPRVDILSVL
jgi:hypothetical protein